MRFNLIFILALLSCSKKTEHANVEVLGHAGMGLRIENSIYHNNSSESIELALSISGCTGVEVDVQLSKDGELWLYHDKELSSESNGSGCVNDFTSTELEQLHYSTFKKEKLIRLNDINPLYLKDKTLLMDIRHFNHCKGVNVDLMQFIAALSSSSILQDPTINSYCVLANPAWIEPFNSAGFKVLLSVEGTGLSAELFDTYPELKGIMSKNKSTDKQLVKEFRQMGKKVYIFEMRSPSGIRSALRKLPDGVVTDDVRATLIEKY
jgi:glycerophosphoryl diester phosphodiesterase